MKKSAFFSFALLLSLMQFGQTTGVFSSGLTNGDQFQPTCGVRDNFDNVICMGQSSTINGYKLYFAKINSWGNPDWSFVLDCNGSSTIGKLIQTSDNNFLAVTGDGGGGIVVKLTTSGSILWVKKFSNIYVFHDVIEDVNGELYFLGKGAIMPIVMKTNSTATVIWSQTFAFSPAPAAYFPERMILTGDGNLAIAGCTSGSGGGMMLFKISKLGVIVWGNIYRSTGVALTGSSLAQSSTDGSFMVTGTSRLGTYFDAAVFKIDNNGGVISSKVLSAVYHDYLYDVVETGVEGQFMVLGKTMLWSNCGGNLLFVKFDSNLDTLLTRSYGLINGSSSWFTKFNRIPGAGYYTVGTGTLWSKHIPLFSMDNVVVKVDSNASGICDPYQQTFTLSSLPLTTSGTISSSTMTPTSTTTYTQTNIAMNTINGCTGQPFGIEEGKTVFSLMAFPNPDKHGFKLKIEGLETNQGLSLGIFDMQGRKVRSVDHLSLNSANETDLIGHECKPGIYLLIAELQNGATVRIMHVVE